MLNPSLKPDREERREARPVPRRLIYSLGAVSLAALTYFLLPSELEAAPRRMAALFVLALALWVTEAIPLFATSLLVITLEVWWVAAAKTAEGAIAYQSFFHALSHPVIFLFLGGFILARAVRQEGIDVQMAGLLLRGFGERPAFILAGIMIVTAGFSMWMSNTATTAMMMVLVAPLAHQVPEGDHFRRALILAVPFAANVGGIGTPIGSTPNALALAQLSERGIEISFLSWMMLGIPLLCITLFATWLVLLLLFRPQAKRLRLRVDKGFSMTPKAMVVYSTFALTVLLWLSSSWHGVPTAVVAMLPAASLTVTRVISKNDFNQLEWHILILIAGGIALGDGIAKTGLDYWILAQLPLEGMAFSLLLSLIAITALLMSTVISNTVTANILLPMALAAAGSNATPLEMKMLAVFCAIMCTYAMALPISTPPNAIAYGTGQISTRDLLFIGGGLSLATAVLVLVTGPWVVAYILG